MTKDKINMFAAKTMGIVARTIRRIIGDEKKIEEEYDADFLNLYRQCQPHSMTSIERMFALYQATNYILDNNIPGDFVECGVWKGGSSLMVALIFKKRNIANRSLYLYDTFEGMSEPTDVDTLQNGQSASDLLANKNKNQGGNIWCDAAIELVKQNISISQLPQDQVIYVKGKVEDTIPQTLPSKIGLLRLDTDWYESTKHEMFHLYPLLETKGVLIIDDYGFWKGAQKAIDEYFDQQTFKPLLQKIDDTGRLLIK